MLGSSAARLRQVSLPQDTDPSPPPRTSTTGGRGLPQVSCAAVAQSRGALACGRAGVTWSTLLLAAAARSVPRELMSPISQEGSCS